MRSKRELIRNTLILALLWCLIMSNIGMVKDIDANTNIARVEVIQSDDAEEGPLIYGGGIDFLVINLTAPKNLTLELLADIWDPNGIDTAIASYKNSTETAWTNVTMTYKWTYNGTVIFMTPNGPVSHNGSVHHFSCNATVFTMDSRHGSVVWNVRYYARNTLGRWTVSDICNYTYSYLGEPPGNTFPIQIVTMILTVGAILLVVNVWYIRRPH